MMPNWDRDAEVQPWRKWLPACRVAPAHRFNGAESGSLTGGLSVYCCIAGTGHGNTLRRL